MDHYLNVFIESVWTASVIPFGNEATLASMQSFGGFDLPLAACIAVIGATLGQSFNWVVGALLLRLKDKSSVHISETGYRKASALFNKYGVFLLLFSWLPLFKILVVAAGFLGARFRFVLPLIVIGQIVNYGRYFL